MCRCSMALAVCPSRPKRGGELKFALRSIAIRRGRPGGCYAPRAGCQRTQRPGMPAEPIPTFEPRKGSTECDDPGQEGVSGYRQLSPWRTSSLSRKQVVELAERGGVADGDRLITHREITALSSAGR